MKPFTSTSTPVIPALVNASLTASFISTSCVSLLPTKSSKNILTTSFAAFTFSASVAGSFPIVFVNVTVPFSSPRVIVTVPFTLPALIVSASFISNLLTSTDTSVMPCFVSSFSTAAFISFDSVVLRTVILFKTSLTTFFAAATLSLSETGS